MALDGGGESGVDGKENDVAGSDNGTGGGGWV